MASRIRIAIDCMGGDLGLRVSLPAAIQAAALYPDLSLTLVGDRALIESHLKPAELASFEVSHAPETIAMSDKPADALRKKKQSSMRVAIDLLSESKVDAVVSAGNTGALMAIGCFVLKTLPGVERPAICSAIPTIAGHNYLLDLGANVDCKAEHLHQFAVMGSALSSSLDGVAEPRVALLNIGKEDIKGTEQVKQAAALIGNNSIINFVGSVEADKIFSNQADVIVCDGFVGNVALKSCEGTATHIAGILRQQFQANWMSRLVALLASPVLKRAYQKLDPQQYNGASLLGLRGIVVKSHGGSTVSGFSRAIGQARAEVNNDLLALIQKRLAKQST